MQRLLLLLPALGLVALLLLLGRGLEWDPRAIPTALQGRQIPDFSLAALDDPGRRLSRQDLLGEPALLNVWATWCPSCRVEHDYLAQLHDTGKIRLVGINYKDDPETARRWLARYGNPYDLVIQDPQGTLGLDLGVFGAPETFLLDAAGRVLHRRLGPMDARIWRTEFAPRLEAL